MYFFFITLVLVMVAVFFLKPVAPMLGLIDNPDSRKRHASPTPVVGGLAMGLSSLAVLWCFDAGQNPHLLSYTIGSLLLILLGARDDIQHLSVTVRLLAQVISAGLLISADLTVTSLGYFPYVGSLDLGVMAIPFTIMVVVGLINAFNMLDGVDGLLGVVTLGMLLLFYISGGMFGGNDYQMLILVVIAAIIGFLYFNMRAPWRSRAQIFMGDAGSMWLGFTVSWLAVSHSQGEGGMPPASVAWILALPVMDTLSLMWRRMRKGHSPFRADREHFHHILQRARFSTGQTVMIISALSLLLGLVGLSLSYLGVSDGWSLLLLAGVFVLYDYAHCRAWLLSKAIRKWLSRSASQ